MRDFITELFPIDEDADGGGLGMSELPSNYANMHAMIKRDERPRLKMWAPGNYMNICTTCGISFCGDKLARQCAPCAYEGEGERPCNG